jgi:hypothetical protein
MNKTVLVAPTVALMLGICVLVLSSPAPAASAVGSVINGTKSIAAYRVGTGYAQARRSFGLQYSSTGSTTTCTARWANGVTIVWRRKPGSNNWAKACVTFSQAQVGKPRVSQPAWRTNKGLRVGARAAQIKSLYPSARGKRSGVYTVWTLQKSPAIVLKAWVKKGRIAFFRLVLA